MGIKLAYNRGTKKYHCDWPKTENALRLNPRQLFACLYSLYQIDEINALKRLELLLHPESSALHDSGPAHGISSGIHPQMENLFSELICAIDQKKVLQIAYKGKSKDIGVRVLSPHKLIHTPISWYLIAWCHDKNDWRSFKLARIQSTRTDCETSYRERDLDLKQYLKGAWYMKKGDAHHKIKVLFSAQAAQSITEYHFHPSQNISHSDDGTVVTWELSHLEEFSSWIMQWAPDFKILEPQELQSIVLSKLQNAVSRHSES